MSLKHLELSKTADAGSRILVRDNEGNRVWRLLASIMDDDRVVEIGKGFALLGNGSRVPLAAFRGTR